ncbi:MAG: zinc ABC transporter substrate-binding protein [Akkermansia sp.]|nr:zinc ABC transporter substrate-binding protein [Akkermansia sp.]
MKKLLCAMLALMLTLASEGSLKVASLHPLLSDMARVVGGNEVEVVDLFPANGELHAFEPTAADVAAAAGAELVLACGKGVEPYLQDLRDSLPSTTRIVELGATVPDVFIPGTRIADPHWWNSPSAMKRASRAIRIELERAFPAGKETFTKGQREYSRKMDWLRRTASLSFVPIAQEKRILVCSHAAMSHFCKEFGFTAIAVHGVAQESEGDTASLARILSQLRQQKVTCLFYGVNDSPKIMQTIASQVGATTRPLVLDGIYPALGSYEELFLFNVRNITKGLFLE